MDANRKLPSKQPTNLVSQFCQKKIEVAQGEPGELKISFGEKTEVIVAHNRCFRESVRVIT